MQFKDLPIGAKCRIKAFKAGSAEYRRRLLMLGISPGCTLEVVRIAPLGDPIEVRVRGCLISVRKDEADILDIEPMA